MTEKARAVIAGEIDMPCPDDGYDEPESTELCAYACTLLRMPGAGMDEDAMELEDIRAFEFGMEHNIDVVWNIMCSLEASTIIIGAYDGVDGSDLYRWIVGRCDDAEKWHRAKRVGMLYMMEKKLSESENPSTRLKRGCGFIVSYPDLVTAKDVSLCIHVPVDAIERTVEDIEKCPFDTTYLGEKR